MQAYHAHKTLFSYTAETKTPTDADMTASSPADAITMAARQSSARNSVATVPAGKGPAPNSPAAEAFVVTGPVAPAVPAANAPTVQGMTAGNGPAFSGPGEQEASSDEGYGSFSDDDLSSWGSMDEVWEADSDYYDTEEEEEAVAGTDGMHHADRLVS